MTQQQKLKMHPIQTLTLNHHPIYIFDLQIPNTARSQRQAVLDKILSQFLQKNLINKPAEFWQKVHQFSHIIHTQGRPAQAIFLANNGKKVAVNLAISYALPFVAVGLSVEKIGVDLCAVADFDGMTEAEKQQFCHDYFSFLPTTIDNSTLANYWSQLEATIKYQQITLAEAVAKPLFLQDLNVISEKVYLHDKVYWLSMSNG